MTTPAQVRTPCRLHFGMFSFGNAQKAQFGGVGAMIGPPVVEVSFSPASRFRAIAILTTARQHVAAEASLRARAEQIVSRLVKAWKLGSLPTCEVVVRSPRDHTGLGVGTQLGLALALGLRRFLDLSELPVEALAAAAGRGARSAVGTRGFQYGGLIVDAGKESNDQLGKLAARTALPETWRFVLICPVGEQGLAGGDEMLAFERLTAVSQDISRELWKITTEQMLPAVARCDCAVFGEAVYQFGRRAGECFAAVQGGPFASAEITRLVASIREFGIPGTGQSSWGPTVFAVTADEDGAQRLVDWLRGEHRGERYEMMIAKPNNRGAIVEG